MNDFEHISLATTYDIDNSFDSDKFIKMRLRVCHDGKNPNGSFFSVKEFSDAEESLKNSLVLAHVVYNEDIDDLDFGSHDMHLEPHQMKNHEGEYKLIYDEQIIGVIPESNNYELEEFEGRNYVYCDCFVSRGYSNYAEDIIQRDKTVQLSMEIDVDSAHYDKSDKTYHIDAFRYRAVTFLGKNVGTGMLKAAGTTESFSKEKVFAMLDELQEEINRHQSFSKKADDKTQLKEDEVIVNEKLELLAKYELTVDALDFNIDDYTLEELESKLEEFKNADQKPDTGENQEDFALQGEVVNELIEKLGEEKVESEWGQYSRYVYTDHDPEKTEVYFWDLTDWKLYGCSYEMKGDAVAIDFNSKGRKKFIIADFIDETDNGFTFSKIVDDIITAKNDAYAQLKAEYDEYVADHSTPNEEVESLREFQAARLDADHKANIDAAIAEFDDLAGNEEFEALVAVGENGEDRKAYTYESVEDLQKELYCIRGKSAKPATFAAKSKTGFVKTPHEIKPTSESPYGDLFDVYGQKD